MTNVIANVFLQAADQRLSSCTISKQRNTQCASSRWPEHKRIDVPGPSLFGPAWKSESTQQKRIYVAGPSLFGPAWKSESTQQKRIDVAVRSLRGLVQKVNRSKSTKLMSLSLPCCNNMHILKSQSIPICESMCENCPPFLHPHPRAISTPKRTALPRGVARAKVVVLRVLRVFMCF